jgi:hypothetical protein
MTKMLVRNRIEDYSRWRKVFESQLPAAREAGLKLLEMWRGLDDPENVFFIFDVMDTGRAREFLERPESAQAGKDSGVLDGEFHFLESEPV